MADSNNSMGLTRWTSTSDPYDSGQLASNFLKIAEHDHTSTKGVQIPTAGIADGAVTKDKTENTVTWAFSTAMPTSPSPVENQLWWTNLGSVQSKLYANDVSNTLTEYRTRWFFRYVAGSSNHWVFTGGSPLIVSNLKSEAQVVSSSDTWTEVNNVNLTIPFKGIYQITFGAKVSPGTFSSTSKLVNLAVDSTTPADATNAISHSSTESATSFVETPSLTNIVNVGTASTNYKLYGKQSVSSGTIGSTTFDNSYIQIIPIYVIP